jgi:Trk K+ transport system NAD-binding subunit
VNTVVATEGEPNYGQTQPSTRQVSPRVRQPRGFFRLLRANLFDLAQLVRQTWFTLALFTAVVAVGAWYDYTVTLKGLGTVPQALYDTLQLIIFQQSSLTFPTDPLGQSLYFLLPILGLLVLVQGVLNFGRRMLDKGSRLESWQLSLATTYRRHVIVCGLGRLGWRVVTRLIAAGYTVVVVERDFQSPFVIRALEANVPVIAGDARETITLQQAGIRRARGVIADVNGDQTNLEIALAARAIRPDVRVVLRTFSAELGENLDKMFGEDSAFSHSALAAPTIAAAAMSRDIVYALPVGNQLLAVTDLAVLAATALDGANADTLEAQHQLRLLDLRRAGRRVSTHKGGVILRPGDRLTLLGALSGLETVRLRNVPAGRRIPLQRPTPEFDTIIICGLGKVGTRVVRLLARVAPDLRIAAICKPGDTTTIHPSVTDLPNVTVIPGDAIELEILKRAGLDRAYAVVAVTSDDLVNVQISLAARNARTDVHVVMRVFSDALAEELNHVYEIHTTYSTSNLASPTLAAAAALSGNHSGWVDRGFTVGGKIYSSDTFTAAPNGPLTGASVGEVRSTRGLLIMSLTSGGQSILLPPLDQRVETGDTGVFVADLDAINRIRTRLEAASRQ